MTTDSIISKVWSFCTTLCEALPNPKHPEHDHWKEWIADYDPARFDLAEVNLRLSVIRV